MTGNEMLSTLGLRLEDPSESNFTQAAKLDALNIAQRSVVNLVNNAYLTDLQVIDRSKGVDAVGSLTITTAGVGYSGSGTLSATGGGGSGFAGTYTVSSGGISTVAITNPGSGYTSVPTIVVSVTNSGGETDAVITAVLGGVLPFSSLTNVPIRNGIVAVRDVTNNKYANMIEPTDVKRLENTYLAGSASNPVAYIFSERIYLEPSTVATIDIWYIKKPIDIGANATECELNIALHETIIDLAESQLWKMDAKVDRAAAAYGNATAQIEALNARYLSEAPKGIGTKGRA
tara:strand:- start:1121 stop:1987 length:867 start_codon:yes stop_codon:yes gene_type:complete